MATKKILSAIIVGKNGVIGKMTRFVKKADGTAPETDLEVFQGIVTKDVTGNNRINCLSIVVSALRNIVEGGIHTKVDAIVIYTLGQFLDRLETSKYWVLTGKKSTGEEVLAEEIALWVEFYALYAQVYSKVIFRNATVLNLEKNTRYVVSDEQRELGARCKLVWEAVDNALGMGTNGFVEAVEDGLVF